jgi:hypothetical protein
MNQPQYGPPPTWQPMPPSGITPAVRKRRKWPWITAGSVVLVIALLAIIGSTAERQDSTHRAGTGTATQPAQSTPAAAPATSTTTPPAPPPAPPVVKTGRGDDVVPVDRAGVKIVKFECPRCTGNTILETDGAESLLVNTIGKYRGQHWVDIREGSVTSTYTIKATGSWTLTIGGLDLARTFASGAATGTGDDVVLMGDHATAAAITNKGGGNFIVEVASIETSRMDLAVNEIGGYSGTVPFDGPALVQVVSEGSWSITPRN